MRLNSILVEFMFSCASFVTRNSIKNCQPNETPGTYWEIGLGDYVLSQKCEKSCFFSYFRHEDMIVTPFAQVSDIMFCITALKFPLCPVFFLVIEHMPLIDVSSHRSWPVCEQWGATLQHWLICRIGEVASKRGCLVYVCPACFVSFYFVLFYLTWSNLIRFYFIVLSPFYLLTAFFLSFFFPDGHQAVTLPLCASRVCQVSGCVLSTR